MSNRIENLEFTYLDVIKELRIKNIELIKSDDIELLQINEKSIKFLESKCKKMDKMRGLKSE